MALVSISLAHFAVGGNCSQHRVLLGCIQAQAGPHSARSSRSRVTNAWPSVLSLLTWAIWGLGVGHAAGSRMVDEGAGQRFLGGGRLSYILHYRLSPHATLARL